MTQARDDPRHRRLHGARAGEGQGRRSSAPTSGRSAACSTRCSPDAARSTARTSPTRSPRSSARSRTGARCRPPRPPVSTAALRCLKKDPKARLQAIGDARILIEDFEHEPVPAASIETARRYASGRRWRAAAAMAILAAVAATVGLVVGRSLSKAERRPTLGPMSRLTSAPGLSTDPSISADGRLMAYASNRGGEGSLDLYVQQTTGGSAIRLTSDPADDREPGRLPGRQRRGVSTRSATPAASMRHRRSEGSRVSLPRMACRQDSLQMGGRLPIGLAPGSPSGVRDTIGGRAFVPVGGGSPVRVASNIVSAGDPVWAPDGQSLVVFGHETASM